MKWRTIPRQVLDFHAWDDEFIVYNPLSGHTHLIGSFAAQILIHLQESPSDAAVLAQTLAGSAEDASAEDLYPEMEQLLSDLEALALIEVTL